jgi:hypothetical protein
LHDAGRTGEEDGRRYTMNKGEDEGDARKSILEFGVFCERKEK